MPGDSSLLFKRAIENHAHGANPTLDPLACMGLDINNHNNYTIELVSIIHIATCMAFSRNKFEYRLAI